MKKNLLTLFVLSALLLIPNAGKATVLLNEHFNQATSTLATNDNNSDISSSSDWTNTTGSGQIYISSTDLTYAGYKSETDETGSAEYKTSFGKKVAKKVSMSVDADHPGSVYVAGIIKISSSSPSTTPSRDYLWSFCNTTTAVATAGNHFGQLAVQKTSEGLQLGIAKSQESKAFIAYTDNLTMNTSYLVVMEYKFVSGAKNDIVYLYLNPTKGDKPEPTLECYQSYENPNTHTDVGSGTKDDPSQLVSFLLYSTSSTKVACFIDELKIVTDWADLWEAGGDPEPDPIGVPEPAASSITLSSATISWDAVEDADSYVLQWKMNGASYSSDIAIDKDVRSYSMSNLEENTKYYVRVKTIVGEDASDWAEINFTTQPEPDVLVYKEISFDKYSTQDAMPTSGQVFLAKNVVEYNDVTLTGNLTLNLHGKQIFLYGTHIIVPSGKTFTIYDDDGDGVITGGYPGSFTDKGIITVQSGGILIIGEGAIVNMSDDSNDYNVSVDINEGGVVKVSGAPNISGVKHDFYLNGSAVITIESDKPLTNATPYKVYKLAGSAITSGWANMGDEKPSDFLASSNSSARGICLNAGEAMIVVTLNFADNVDNTTAMGTYSGQLTNITIGRSFSSAQYNTISLPFALSDAQMEEFFGAEYDLEEFVSSSLEDEVLSLTFNKVTALEAGKPYLLQPSIDVVNPSFEGVTITATSPADQTSDEYISFHGTFSPTSLEGGNRNLLFLGAGNELFWPASDGEIKAFRAYFEVKNLGGNAPKARIVKKEDAATGVDQITNDKSPMTNKILRNGEILILRDGKTYNVLGMECK